MKKNLKKFKKEKIKQIQNLYKFIYIYQYKDLNSKEFIEIKKKLKKLNFYFYILKQNLIINRIKGQGPIIYIYTNENYFFIEYFYMFKIFKKFNLISFKLNNIEYTNKKLDNLYKIKNNLTLNYLIKKPIIKFLFILKKINKWRI